MAQRHAGKGALHILTPVEVRLAQSFPSRNTGQTQIDAKSLCGLGLLCIVPSRTSRVCQKCACHCWTIARKLCHTMEKACCNMLQQRLRQFVVLQTRPDKAGRDQVGWPTFRMSSWVVMQAMVTLRSTTGVMISAMVLSMARDTSLGRGSLSASIPRFALMLMCCWMLIAAAASGVPAPAPVTEYINAGCVCAQPS